MKIRLDHVANSSSASYVCEICGETQGGWDMGLSEAEMIQCVEDHIVCMSHASEIPEEESEEYPYEVPSAYCPICTMEHIRDCDLVDYLLAITGQFSSKEAAKEDMRAGCTGPSLEQFTKWLAKNQW